MDLIGVYEWQEAPDAHLVEVKLNLRPSAVDVGGFTQETPDQPRDSWQVPWMEHYLSPDGEDVIAAAFEVPTSDEAPTRLVFWLHFLALDRPLITPFGELTLTSPQPLPDRLHGKVEFEPVD